MWDTLRGRLVTGSSMLCSPVCCLTKAPSLGSQSLGWSLSRCCCSQLSYVVIKDANGGHWCALLCWELGEKMGWKPFWGKWISKTVLVPKMSPPPCALVDSAFFCHFMVLLGREEQIDRGNMSRNQETPAPLLLPRLSCPASPAFSESRKTSLLLRSLPWWPLNSSALSLL